jgi:hypothetical protein
MSGTAACFLIAMLMTPLGIAFSATNLRAKIVDGTDQLLDLFISM